MLPNPYKVRRKWRRQGAVKAEHSFAEPKAPNPYRAKEKVSHWRRYVLLFLGLLSIFGMSILLLTHPFFAISKIEISGTERLSEELIRQSIEEKLGTVLYEKLPFSGRAYLLIRVAGVRAWLMERFSLEQAVVRKEFPNTLRITVTERLSNVILDDGVSYRFVGLQGEVLDTVAPVGANSWEQEVQVSTTTLADGTIRRNEEVVSRTHTPEVERMRSVAGDYPILLVVRQRTPSSTPEVLSSVDPLLVARTIEWYEYLSKKTDIPFWYIEKQGNPGPYATLFTKEGWRLFIPLNESAKEVAPRLEAVLSKHVPRKNLQYIDMRYPGLVYWR